ncbi:potassium transporter KefG [Agarivorans sp. Toyoura001]|uniref:NAD(P)H-dependent oxidoreductase n=1 Tax=Agarivorans sp. Toyoura001 TaxID=2283141 RepID=UPI0010D3A831|nr:NAD(P)H-dependent oxidoreductase [Agarivorans sp. Toyoura001]GDY24805.1 potassium transporter KefG [Agarivorans sp. Toyoura001]
MPQQNQKVLVLFAHPSQDRSEINRPMFKLASNIEGVTAVDLYREYPTFRINVDKEQQRLLEHDIVIMQFPLYWYSTPAILKEWQDLVLEYGFAYGHDGKMLHGKSLLCAITAGGAENAYCDKGYNHFTIRELLHPLEQTASLIGMRYLAPFALFASRTAAEEQRVGVHLNNWKKLLVNLVENKVDLELASRLDKLTQLPNNLFKEAL